VEETRGKESLAIAARNVEVLPLLSSSDEISRNLSSICFVYCNSRFLGVQIGFWLSCKRNLSRNRAVYVIERKPRVV